MIILDVKQGSPEWIKSRLGIPTASRFDQIITLKGQLSKQADGYMHELLAESLLGEPADSFKSGFMQRGSEQEQEAVRFYEFQKDIEIKRVGFCMLDNKRVGCSPDGLIGTDGGIEIKCPAAKNHIAHLLNSVGNSYRAQVQGCLWITERDWWDIFSFNPYMGPAIVRCNRDEDYIKTLAESVDAFLDKFDAAKGKLKEMGAVPADAEFPFDN